MTILKILLTGASGFIGSHFVEQILDRTNHEIISIDRLDSSGYHGRLHDLPHWERHRKRVKNVFHDLKAAINDYVAYEIGAVDFVFHLAAGTHVDRSISNPMEFVQDNVVGTCNLLDYCRNKVNIKGFFYFSCYDEKTRALTTNGLQRYDEIKIGDKVISINPKTKEIEEKEIKNIIVQQYDGPMIHFETNRMDLFVTPNHRMLVQDRANKNKVNFMEANELRKLTNKELVDGEWIGQCNETINDKFYSEDLFYMVGAFLGDGFLATQISRFSNKSGLTKKERLKKARDSKTGRIIKTDKIGDLEFSSTICYRIFFDVPEKDKCRARLEKSLTALGIDFHAHKGKAGEHIYFSSQYWSNFLSQFGHGARNKFIPGWMLQAPRHLLQALFDGLIDSDGYRGKQWIQYTTTSEHLLAGICEIAIKLGRFPKFKLRDSENIFQGRTIKGSAFYVHFPEENPTIGKQNAKEELYCGKIWCLTVDGNANFVAERNGHLAFCGNTDEVYGPAAPGVAHKETDRHRATNPYAASKSGAESLVTAYGNTYRLPHIITNTMNVFGPRQHPEKFIPMVISKVMRGEKIVIHADPTRTKPGSRFYIHAANVADGYLFLMDRWKNGEVYNLVGEREVDNLQLAESIALCVGKPLEYELVDFHSSRPGHDLRYALDGTKMKDMGWHPIDTFEQSIAKTVQWYMDNPKWLMM
jgi:dTDP-D-glucose 4,6-dehydratase/intein/homing endonuclease